MLLQWEHGLIFICYCTSVMQVINKNYSLGIKKTIIITFSADGILLVVLVVNHVWSTALTALWSPECTHVSTIHLQPKYFSLHSGHCKLTIVVCASSEKNDTFPTNAGLLKRMREVFCVGKICWRQVQIFVFWVCNTKRTVSAFYNISGDVTNFISHNLTVLNLIKVSSTHIKLLFIM